MNNNSLNHLAIIPDGNTRWAQTNGFSIQKGYQSGLNRIGEISRYSRKLGIHTLTLWGLSTENWQVRPKAELEFLIKLFIKIFDEHIGDAQKENVKIVHLGRKDRLPKKLLHKIADAEMRTKNNTKHILNIALDYGGHDEIIRAIEKVVNDVKLDKIKVADLKNVIEQDDGTRKTVFSNYLDTGSQPYPFPDLIIRTSGEIRTSGFLPWQSIYSEFHFEKSFFPDFTTKKLDKGIKIYNSRKRRFGGGHKI